MNRAFEDVKALCTRVRAAAPALGVADHATRCRLLAAMAKALPQAKEPILAANARDLAAADQNGVPRVMLDRLMLNSDRLSAISAAIEMLISLPDPLVGGEQWERPNGLTITKQPVPFGVVAMIYEARPNVTADAAALAVKSGNAVVLRGGKEAILTNTAIVSALKRAVADEGFSPDLIGLVEDTSRESATALLSMRGLVDVLIPRGGKGLIRSCVDNAKVPVIETGAGNCHIYVDAAADLDKALAVAVNAKCQRPSVCNAAESLLCHSAVAAKFLPAFFEATRPWQVSFRACPRARALLPEAELATEEDFYTEFNDYVMSVKIVDSVEQAVEEVNRTGTGHSEAIMTEDEAAAAYFLGRVDAAAVYHNASTRFTDGGEFGFGAEIGISTQKMHARGPMGPAALTTVKYLVKGNGTVR
ncbi:MAG: glutamate-5-semialdehyde dehydrogenase [Ruminococcaceae bacterium]|nr:glutamate-5-semialdehyde dehydrogenase [Oscillospiraceae bacterium]